MTRCKREAKGYDGVPCPMPCDMMVWDGGWRVVVAWCRSVVAWLRSRSRSRFELGTRMFHHDTWSDAWVGAPMRRDAICGARPTFSFEHPAVWSMPKTKPTSWTVLTRMCSLHHHDSCDPTPHSIRDVSYGCSCTRFRAPLFFRPPAQDDMCTVQSLCCGWVHTAHMGTWYRLCRAHTHLSPAG